MPTDWGLEYLKGNIPGSRQESPAQTPPEKTAVPAKTSQEADKSEVQKSEAQVPRDHSTDETPEPQKPEKPDVFAAIDAVRNEAELRQVLIKHFGLPDLQE